MRVLVAVLLCAVAFGQASACEWGCCRRRCTCGPPLHFNLFENLSYQFDAGPMHHRKCHDNICNPRRWDRVFKTKGPK
jgi:hypothetical protein